MKGLKRALTWCVLLNKRFLKRPAFLAILALAPLLALALRAAAGQEGGVLTVALCPGDAFSESIVDSLLEEGGVLRYRVCADEDEARALVAGGRADAAWIFSDRAERELERHIAGRRAAVVTVVEREDNVFLMLSREKLYAALYPAISYRAYAAFLAREMGEEALPEDELSVYYRRGTMDRELVALSYMDGSEAVGGEGLLLSPVRGLLSILVVLGGLAAAVVLPEDRRRGAFTWLRRGAARAAAAAYLTLPALDIALAALAALLLAGLSVGAAYEALLMLLLALAGAGFAGLVTLLCRTPERIGVAALALTVCMLALCPVFLDLRQLRAASVLFPPWWYLHAVHAPVYAVGLAAYAAALWLLDLLLYSLVDTKLH